jgi:hypothetical protein
VCSGAGSGAALGRARTAGRGGFGQRRADVKPVGHGAPLWHGAIAVPPRAANPGAVRGGLAADMRPHMSANFKYQKNLKISSPHKKNRYKVRKNLKKLMVVVNPIWNTFHDYNFLRFSTNFELFQRFQVKLDLTKLCSISLVATAIETSPQLNCGQGVLHGAL